MQQWVQFELGGEKYAHPVQTVKEVLRYQEPNPVPGSPSEVEGILNIRGEVITVFSGRKLLELDIAEQPSEARIIALELPQGRFGISVDGVDGIVHFAKDEIDTNQHGNSDLIQGTHQRGDQLLIVTDFSQFFDGVNLPQ